MKTGDTKFPKVFVPANAPEDWRALLAEPEKQWEPHYSARELAYCWQPAQDFPATVRKALEESGIPELRGLNMLIALPEYKVELPPFRRAPSQNDIFVLASNESGLVAITVEGKVAEPFAKTVVETMKEADQREGVSRARERLDALCSLLGCDVGEVQDVRYQLLHRLASAIIESKKFHAPSAMMLVHSFSKNNQSFEDYRRFCEIMGADASVGRVHRAKTAPAGTAAPAVYLGWINEFGSQATE